MVFMDTTNTINYYETYPERVLDFLNYSSTIRGKSDSTIEAYRYDLGLFFRFLKRYRKLVTPDIPFDEILIHDIDDDFLKKVTLSEIYAFLSYMDKQRQNSAYARARKTACIKTFFKYLSVKARIIDKDPTLELERPKIKKRNPVYLTLDESRTLLRSMDKENINYKRDYCILTLFLNCGMRLSELVNIRISKIKNDTLTVIGKGNKERVVYLNQASINSIHQYMSVRSEIETKDEYKDYLFLSTQKRPINKRTVEILVKKHVHTAGLYDDKYTPHKLRHTAATLMYKHGKVDIRSLQMILGHENVSTTQIYTHVDNDALREAVNLNPLADETE